VRPETQASSGTKIACRFVATRVVAGSAPTPVILTIDQGTSRQKVALFDQGGRLVAQHDARNRELTDSTGRHQMASEWWQSACTLATGLVSADKVTVVAIAVSGRAGAGIFIDRHGDIVQEPWSDQRHSAELADLRADFPDLSLYGATLLAKLLYHRRRTGGNDERCLYAKDYLVYRLCGRCVTDPSSGPDALTWPAPVLRSRDIDVAQLPEVALPWQVVGEVSVSAAKELGITTGTPVVLGAHDGICANVGAGVLGPDAFSLTLGTHGVVRSVVPSVPGAHVKRFYGMPPDLHVVGTTTLMSGRALDWLLDQAFADRSNRRVLFAELDAWAGEQPPGSDGVLFFPYLAGQMSPRPRPGVRAGFHGLGLGHDRRHLYQAVLEGVSYAIAANFDQLRDWLGDPGRVAVTGSAAASGPWVQMLADLTGHPLMLTDVASEGRGAAIFASVALGYQPTLARAVGQMVKTSGIVEPDDRRVARYGELRATWQAAADALPD
jgi:sugar (pentulose or hexulose) kinase